MTRIYLDHAATTPLRPEARAAMEQGFALWANPSSPHAEGRAARAALENARERMKAVLGWQGEVIFTSGASEALALAMRQAKAPLKAVSAVEHDAVLRHAADAARLPVDDLGRVIVEGADLAGLIAIQHANSETGVIQPIAEFAEAVRAAGGVLLCDCAQSAGKMPLPDADIIVLAAHKFGGPVGVGALLVRDWALLNPDGGQERGYRGGTENLPAVMAMVAALEAGPGDMAELRARLESGLIAAGAEVVASAADRIATIGAVRRPRMAAAAQLIRLDAAGFAVSAGSACSSGSLKPSHVLTAMAYPHTSEIIRVSLGWNSTAADVDAFVAAWTDMGGAR